MKIAAFSDSHWLYKDIGEFPEADMVLFAGDWSGYGRKDEQDEFLDWFAALPYKYKVAIPGNHDRYCEAMQSETVDQFGSKGVELLIDRGIEIEGLSIYGTPWCPVFGPWAFMADPEQQEEKFSMIPKGTDILLTHSPAAGTLDEGYGSSVLKKHIGRAKPRLHIFGHIHECYGYREKDGTEYRNVALCSPPDFQYGFTYKLIRPVQYFEFK